MTVTGERLLFSGTCWTAASITAARRVASIEELIFERAFSAAQKQAPMLWNRLALGGVPPGLKKTPCSVFTLAVTSASAGRQWSATEPECFWRSFSELNFTKGDGADVLHFVRRRGDPFNALAQRQQTDTTEWVHPALDLAKVAAAWEPQAGHDGVSRLGEDHERQQEAEEVLRTALLPHAVRDCDVALDPAGPGATVSARSLLAYMTLSAASAFRRAAPMRRCMNCLQWYELRRTDMRFCSASCRAIANKGA